MSNKINFVDQTIRDAQQGLWGLLMRTDMITPIAGIMDQVGYRNIATVGSQAFKVQVRNLGENPRERIRTLAGSPPLRRLPWCLGCTINKRSGDALFIEEGSKETHQLNNHGDIPYVELYTQKKVLGF